MLFGHRIEPMTDLYLIEAMEDVRFVGEKPQDMGMVLGFDRPWEREGSLGLTVFEDQGTVKMYYRGFPTMDSDGDLSHMQAACLATSPDGIHFTRFPVNRFSYDGITENNIVNMGAFCHNFAGFLDRNPLCPPQERYKAIGGYLQLGGLFAFGSPDGVCWHKLQEAPVITKGNFDSMNLAFYDTAAGCYRCYSRYAFEDRVRCIQSCTSRDFLHWTDPVPNQYPDLAEMEQLYTNAATPIPGAEHMLLSLPMRFADHRETTVDCSQSGYLSGRADVSYRKGLSDCVLMTSRDGVVWDRKLKDAWITGGLSPHEWTQRSFITLGGVIVRGEDFYLYTEKNYMWNDDGIFLYKIPRYRFMSLYADDSGGHILTKPLTMTGDTFHLNFATSAYGSIRIRVLAEDGTDLCRSPELYGNELSRPVTFPGLAGKTVRLSISLNAAHLYAMGSPM